ncbi:tyrosine-type recombinase/integrase [Pseudonocardia sp. GCM10023141]|uniref:tyrosine-type recombinase/integrase n=1 Tax=Pseudonocardia sp. GCM10023141 TaxID=3252653 RepID=UPI0036223C3A
MTDAEVAAARLLLARLGISPEQLIRNCAGETPSMPTFREYVEQVGNAVQPGTRRVYETYWRRIVQAWGDRRLDEPTPLEITQLAEHVKTTVVVRRNARGGRSAAEHLIAALRCVYRYAAADGLIADADNPARRVAKPRRLASTRRALPDARLAEINNIVATTGNDPELDSLMLRLHTETACRRGGALALRPADLDVQQCVVCLREKGETTRWQPVSPTLMRHLVLHGTDRDAQPTEQLLRYRGGQPITTRRYDYLWERVGRNLPWAATQQISTHWLRHTTLTWVERHFGYAVARAYAGHNGRSDAGTTTTYIRADVHEVAAALAAMVGEPHPLAFIEPDPDQPTNGFTAVSLPSTTRQP